MTDVIEQASGIPRQWGGLNRNLVARVFLCDAKGIEDVSEPSIFGPISETSFDVQLGWQSPFEGSGVGSAIPSLLSLIQSGQLSAVVNALQASGLAPESANGLLHAAKAGASRLEGRSGVTKLNSRQIFASAGPVKISLQMHFRSFADPESEVLRPYQRLLEWALPQELAEDGFLAETLKNRPGNGQELLRAIFPSRSPRMVGLGYSGERYAPLVIESLGHPIDGPRDRYGLPIFRTVQMVLTSLTALDRAEVAKIFLTR